MPLTSHEIAAIAQQQQAMFGNVANYATQITPIQGGVPGMQRQISPYMPPGFVPGIGGGYYSGPAPIPPPRMATPGWSPSPYGGIAQMAMGLPMARPGSNLAPVMGEQMMGSAMGGLSTIASGAASIGNAAVGAAGMLSLGAGAIGAVGGLASGAGLMAGAAAGTAALGAIPVLGGAVTALGGPVAGGVLLGLEAMRFTTQQVYAGVQERQMINRTLRQNFGGVRGIGQGPGGMGFSTNEMGEISTMVRSMAGNDIMASFEDLNNVLGRTAQMGMYRGVRSADQFRQRFRETVSSLREIAQTMHTSLEDATRYMEGSRQMGFFTGQQINSNLMRTRLMAGATGMSFDQMQQIGMQGAQMGRAMGMRGRTGAGAMQEMATNLAMGIRTGSFSDEMIAEATGGLTGAEGAQAAAGRLMEINQRWLKQGPGRVMMAALWDPSTGRINESRLQQALAGGMSFQQLRSMGRRNIAETGGRRSEFFRDEERLAGEMMEAGGAPLMLGMIEQHFGKRRDLNLEDPIMQRWLRRRFDMSQGEVELFVKQARDMPRIMEERRRSFAQQIEQEAMTRAREGTGIQGLERKIKNWWERDITGPLKQVGDDLTTSMSNAVQDVVDDLEGTVRTTVSERAKQSMIALGATGGRYKGGLMSTKQYNDWQVSRDLTSAQREFEGGFMGWVGRTIGTRADTLENQLEGIRGGLTQEEKTRLDRMTTVKGKSMFFNQYAQTIMGGGRELGFSMEQLAGLSREAEQIVLSTGGPGGSANQLGRWISGAGTDSAKAAQVMDRVLGFYASKSPEIAAAVAKAKTRAEKVGLLRTLGGRFQEGSTFAMGGLLKTLAPDITGYGMSIEAAQAQQRKADADIGALVAGWTTTPKKTPGLLQVLANTRGGRGGYVRDESQEEWTRSNAATKELLKNAEIRDLMIAAVEGSGAAMQELTRIGGGMTAEEVKERYGISEGSQKNLNEIVAKLRGGDSADRTAFINSLKSRQEGMLAEESTAVFEREKQLGLELSTRMSRDTVLQGALERVGPEAKTQLDQIETLRASGTRDDIARAYQLEQEFIRRYGGSDAAAELSASLAEGGGAGTALSLGLNRYTQAKQHYSSRRGGRELSALETTLRDMGAGTLEEAFGVEKLSKKDRTRLTQALQKGMSAEDLMKQLGARGKGRLAEGGKAVEAQLTEVLGILGGGGIKGVEEAEQLAAIEAGRVTSETRARGAGGDKSAMTSLAEKQANYLKTLVEVGNRQLEKLGGVIVAMDEVGNAIKDNPPNANAAGGTSSGGGGALTRPAGGTR